MVGNPLEGVLSECCWSNNVSRRRDKAMQRVLFVAAVVVLGATFGAESWKPLEAQEAAFPWGDPEAVCRSPRTVCEGFDRFRLTPEYRPTC